MRQIPETQVGIVHDQNLHIRPRSGRRAGARTDDRRAMMVLPPRSPGYHATRKTQPPVTKRRPTDSRLAASRYAVDRAATPAEQADDEPVDRGQPTLDQRAQIVEIAIQQAMRRGDFDDLPGAGRPLADLGGVRDPDWWIRRKIEREGLTGLGPPALTLRTEDAGLDDRLDTLATEERVREALDDFNRRVREAQRQLLGGPPVITRPREVESEVAAWQHRRAERLRALQAERERQHAAVAALPWRERRRARRGH